MILLEQMFEQKDRLLDEYIRLQEAGIRQWGVIVPTALALTFGSMGKLVHAQTISWSQAIRNYKEDPDIVAKVIAGEAASEGEYGMRLVANVIQNRAKAMGINPRDIVLQRKQFSCLTFPDMMERNYKDVKEIADKLASQIGNLPDELDGAKNYVTKSLYRKVLKDPEWAKSKGLDWILKMEPVKEYGNHVFLKEK